MTRRWFTPRRLWRRYFPRRFGLGYRPTEYSPAPADPMCPDYLIWGVIGWHYRLQRPQHLAMELARAGRRVFYISSEFVDHPGSGFRVESLDEEGRLFQVFLHLRGAPPIYYKPPVKEALRQLRGGVERLVAWGTINNPVSLVHHPFWYELAALSGVTDRLVYDRMDLHEGFHIGMNTYSVALAQMEKSLMVRADLTITTSAWLDQDTALHTKRRLLLRNAGDYQHFSAICNPCFKDNAGRRVIGYFGAIANWMDLELVAAVARHFPDCLLLLIGHDQCEAASHLSTFPNVRLTGEMPYHRLPFYLHGFDVCILPFRRIPLTLATNPVKIYEYLSAGKPVVAVALPEIELLSDILTVARNQDEFLAGVTQALTESQDAVLVARRQEFAAQQTWVHRAQVLRDAVERSSGQT